MSGQPLVSALSVCGPAVGRAVSYGDIDEVFGGRDEPKYIPQAKAPVRIGETTAALPRSAMANTAIENKQTARAAISDLPPNFSRQPPPAAPVPKTAKKPMGTNNQKPPFLVGKAPVRNNLTTPKPQPAAVGTLDNRAEITELKRQIGELSHLLRLHVESKVTKRDVGTDPIVFEAEKAETAMNTDTSASLCSKCKRLVGSPVSPVPSSVIEDSPEHNTSLCSQLESLAMQYLSDDQLANIAHGHRAGALVAKKPSSNNKKHRRERKQPDPLVETSPPKRRMAAVATTAESNTISPSFGTSGGMTLTRRRVMTMEQQVSIFGDEPRGSSAKSLPLGFSVASQEFMQRHGVLKTSSSKPRALPAQRRDFRGEDEYARHYYQRDRHEDFQRNYGEASVVRPRNHNYNYPRQLHDAEDYFEDEWD